MTGWAAADCYCAATVQIVSTRQTWSSWTYEQSRRTITCRINTNTFDHQLEAHTMAADGGAGEHSKSPPPLGDND